jgi:hypothetical protein
VHLLVSMRAVWIEDAMRRGGCIAPATRIDLDAPIEQRSRAAFVRMSSLGEEGLT